MRFRKWSLGGAVALLGATLALGGAPAGAQTFDFESSVGGTTIVVTDSGLTVTLYRADGGSIGAFGPIGPASWGMVTLLAYPTTIPGIIADFSAPVSFASIQSGDYNADDDLIEMTAYAGLGATGAVLDTDSVVYPAVKDIGSGDSDVVTLSVSAAGIQSVLFTETNAFPDSVYWDNLVVTAAPVVPEPGTLALLAGLGLPALALLRRRKA